MPDTKNVHQIWSDFLNPDVLRRRFLTAGLFIVAHEKLLEAIKTPLFTFFSSRWTASDGWKESAEYREEVLALDPKGKSDALRGSVRWLLENQVIDAEDEATVRLATEARNVFAHELSQIVSGSGQPPDFEFLFPRLVKVIVKIERWWIFNVEIAVENEFCLEGIEPNSIMPPSMLFLQVLELVALGNEEAAWELYKKFRDSDGGNL